MIWEFDCHDSKGLDALCQIRNTLYSNPNDQYLHDNIVRNACIKGFVYGDKTMPEAGLMLYNSDVLIDNQRIVFLGYFDSLNYGAGILLVQYAIDYCKANLPNTILVGPVNGSTWGNYRLPVNAFESLFPGDIAGKDYYPDIFNDLGFEVYCKYSTHIQSVLIPDSSKPVNGCKIEYLNKSEIMSSMNEIYELSMEAFKTAPLFQPIDFTLFETKYNQSLKQLDTKLMPFVKDSNNKIVAYLLAYPSYDKEALVIKTLARKSGRQYAGLGMLLANEIVNQAIGLGYKKIYHALMNQSNVSKVLSRNISGTPCKNYSVYSYKLN